MEITQEKIDHYRKTLRGWSLDGLLEEYATARRKWREEDWDRTYQIQLDIVKAEIQRRIAG